VKSFEPRLDVLPTAQRQLWPELVRVPPDFVLYGGTALALRLGHRQSVDFDFFSSIPFETAKLQAELGWAAEAEVLQFQPNTLTLAVQRQGPVKVSFFGGLSFGRVGTPEFASASRVCVAALLDLAATKLKVVQERAESRDYVDLFHLLRAGVNLEDGLGAAQAVYGQLFNPTISVKALSYFGDGDLPRLPEETKQFLAQAAAAVREIPVVKRLSDKIAGQP
jgi:hypothetical protein